MHAESIREFCLALPAVTESFPFDETTLVFKVGNEVKNKMFALVSLEAQPVRVNLKCDPDRAIELRERFASVLTGYHMNKQLWNTIICDGELEDEFIKELILHSYDLIVESMPKKVREALPQR